MGGDGSSPPVGAEDVGLRAAGLPCGFGLGGFWGGPRVSVATPPTTTNDKLEPSRSERGRLRWAPEAVGACRAPSLYTASRSPEPNKTE